MNTPGTGSPSPVYRPPTSVFRTLRTLFWLALLPGLAVGIYFFVAGASQEKPSAVACIRLTQATILESITIPGSLQPEEEIFVKSNIPGIIDELYVKAGDVVRVGQPIARLRVIPEMNQLNEAEFAVEEARRRLQNAETDFTRVEGLVQQGAIPRVELQPTQLALDLARQQLTKAETALQLLRDGISRRTGRQFNIITATASGTLLDVPMKTGANIVPSNSLNEGTTIASIANLGNMIFVGKAIEGVVGKIRVGQQALLSLGAYPDDTLNSVIYFISPKGKDNNGNIEFEVKSRVAPRSGVVVRAGYSANARIVINRKVGCMALPESAIAYTGDSTFAEVLVDSVTQSFRRIPIQTGISDGVQTEILSTHPAGTQFRKILE